jgi:23S rRNA pseudouridine1911/1915/1917 synthase
MKKISLTVEADIPGEMRVDKYLSEHLGLFSRSRLKNLLLRVLMNGREVKPSKRVEPGAALEIEYKEEEGPEYAPEALDFSVIYEDENVLVVDKPQGMVVHPGSGVRSGTLVQGLLHHVLGLGQRFPGEPLRPGIVHRLDKDTSGIIITAKDPISLEYLGRQFRNKTTGKTYLAVVRGGPPEQNGVVEGFIGRDPLHRKRFVPLERGGKSARTEYKVLKRFDAYTLVLLRPSTGRTHQLRVHLKSLGCPILGDPIYGKKDPRFPGATLMLHAYRLSIVLPGGMEKTFRAPLPGRFKEVLAALSHKEAMRSGL